MFFKIRWRYMLLLNSNAHLKNIAFNSKQEQVVCHVEYCVIANDSTITFKIDM